MEWENKNFDEQETTITIDYFERKLYFYTTRQSVARKLIKKIGEPDKVETTDEKICAISYERDLSSSTIKSFLSTTIIVGGFRKEKELKR